MLRQVKRKVSKLQSNKATMQAMGTCIVVFSPYNMDHSK